MPTANLQNSQTLQAVVNGPSGANRLFTCTGIAGVGVFVNGNQSKTETWTVRVGPTLTRPQFHQAVATATISAVSLNLQAAPFSYSYNVLSIEADWDEESGLVELRFEISLSAQGASIGLSINAIAFAATILAEL